MDQEFFVEKYREARDRQKERFESNAEMLRPFYPNDEYTYPPVLGLGFRPEAKEVPIITVSLNPHVDEFKGQFLKTGFDPDSQWQGQSRYFMNPNDKTFRRVQALVKGVSQGKNSFGGAFGGLPTAVHFFLSPYVTEKIARGTSKFIGYEKVFKSIVGDTLFEKEYNLALKLLVEDLERSLFPMIANFVENHGTKIIIFTGWIPSKKTTNEVFKALQGEVNYFEMEGEPQTFAKMKLAMGKFGGETPCGLGAKDDLRLLFFAKDATATGSEAAFKEAGEAASAALAL